MKKHDFRKMTPGGRSITALLLALLIVLSLPACGKPKPASAPTDAPSPTETTAAPPVPTDAEPAAEDERTVYVPAYEPLSPTMDGISVRFPVETEDGVYFMRLVQSAEGSGYRLMRGGKDAENPVTVAAFAPEFYVERAFLTNEGTAWVNRTDAATGEAALVEISLDSGETLREIPFDAADGTVTGLFDLPDGSLGVVTLLPAMTQALFSMDEAGLFTPVEAPLNTDGDFRHNVTFCGTEGSGLPTGECLAYDSESLFAFTPGSGERRELLRWADWGISAFNTAPLRMADGVIRLVDYRYNEVITLTPTPESEVKPRQELTMACLNLQTAVEDAVRDFNRRSGEWYITVRDYSGGRPFTMDVQDQAITAMNLDIVSGRMPDLVSVQDGVPFQSYAEKGLLRDLTEDFRSEGIELLPQLRRAGTVDGKLLMACGSFAILTATGSRDFVGDMAGWTAAEAVALADSLPDCRSVFTSFMTRDRYLAWLSFYLEGYLDWDGGTASFDTPEFRDILTLAAALPTEPPMENTVDAELMEGRSLVNPATITSIKSWQIQDVVYLGKLAAPGFPTGDGVGSLIYMQVPVAVSAASAHPEGALAFLRSMLNENAQTAYTSLFPSTQTAFEKQLAEVMREPNPEDGYTVIYYLPNGGQFMDPTVYLWEGEGERQPRSILYWMDESGGIYREEPLYAMSEEQRDRLLALLDRAERSTSYDQTVYRIVQEESGALFAGQRDVEAVTRRIQARVELYLAEQG